MSDIVIKSILVSKESVYFDIFISFQEFSNSWESERVSNINFIKILDSLFNEFSSRLTSSELTVQSKSVFILSEKVKKKVK